MIRPFLKRGSNLERYVQRLEQFVNTELERVTGENLDYNPVSGEQSSAIASIFAGSMSAGPSLGLRMEIRQTLSLTLSSRLDDYIDIEQCDDPESAFIGAYSAMLHEVGHHMDWNSMNYEYDFLRGAQNEECSESLITEVVCDKVARVLGQQFGESINPGERQRRYWISKLGLFSGFLIRMDLDMYDPEQTLNSLLRFRIDFSQAAKMKVLGDDLRVEINKALEVIRDLLNGLIRKSGGEVNWEKVNNLEHTMKLVQRNVTAALVCARY